MIFPNIESVPEWTRIALKLALPQLTNGSSCGRLRNLMQGHRRPAFPLVGAGSLDFFSAGNPEKISIVPRSQPLTQGKRCDPGTTGEKKPKLLSLGLNPPKEEGGGDTC